MKITEPRLLYFTAGVQVTDEDREAAFKITRNVGFRNGSMKTGDKVEDTDAIAGNLDHIPEAYQRAYFHVATAKQLAKAAEAKANGEVPEAKSTFADDTATDDDLVEPVEPVEPDLTDKSDDFKAGYEDGKVKKEYKPDEVSDDYKSGYTEALSFGKATEAYATELEAYNNARTEADAKKAKAAKANKPKAPAKVPKWGRNN